MLRHGNPAHLLHTEAVILCKTISIVAAQEGLPGKPLRTCRSETSLMQAGDDDMFWDYGPPNPPKAAPVKILPERKANGAASNRPAPAPEKVSTMLSDAQCASVHL